jgi:copper resistance protein C
MSPSRTLLVMLLAALGVLGLASPAWAHSKLRSSTPAAGSTLDAAPSQVSLTFNEDVTLPASGAVTVTGPDGAAWTVGRATAAGPTVTAPVTPSGPAGAYTLKWTVVSDDGDPVSGTVAFTLSAPAAADPAAGPAPVTQPVGVPLQGDGGAPAWVWVLLGVIVLAGAGVAVALRNARGRTR